MPALQDSYSDRELLLHQVSHPLLYRIPDQKQTLMSWPSNVHVFHQISILCFNPVSMLPCSCDQSCGVILDHFLVCTKQPTRMLFACIHDVYVSAVTNTFTPFAFAICLDCKCANSTATTMNLHHACKTFRIPNYDGQFHNHGIDVVIFVNCETNDPPIVKMTLKWMFLS